MLIEMPSLLLRKVSIFTQENFSLASSGGCTRYIEDIN